MKPLLITVNHDPKTITREFAWLQADRHRSLLLEFLSEHPLFAFAICCIEVHCSHRKHRKVPRGEAVLEQRPVQLLRRRVIAPRDEFEEPEPQPEDETEADAAQGERETVEDPDANLRVNLRNTPLYGYPHYHIAAYFFSDECQLVSWREVGQKLLRPPFTDVDVKRVNTRRVLSVEKAFSYILKDYSHPACLELLRHYSPSRPFPIMVYFNQLDSKFMFNQFFEDIQEWIPLYIKDSAPIRGRFTESMKVPYSDRPIDQFFFRVTKYMLTHHLAYYDGYVYQLVPGAEYTYTLLEEVSKFIMGAFANLAQNKSLVLQHAQHFLQLCALSPDNSILPALRTDWDWIEYKDKLFRLSTNESFTKHNDLDVTHIHLKGQPSRFFNKSFPYNEMIFRPEVPKKWLSVLKTNLDVHPSMLESEVSKFCAQFMRHFFPKRHRERCMFMMGPTRSGKSLLVAPLHEFFPMPLIGFPGSGMATFVAALCKDMRVIIMEDFKASYMYAQDCLRILGGEIMGYNDKNVSGRGRAFRVTCNAIITANNNFALIYHKSSKEIIDALNDRVNYWYLKQYELPSGKHDDEKMMEEVKKETYQVVHFCNWWRVRLYEETENPIYLP